LAVLDQKKGGLNSITLLYVAHVGHLRQVIGRSKWSLCFSRVSTSRSFLNSL